ncbi:alpha/beta hydrolase [Jannaschia sp. Os4]|uniref:alpha/beta fold hydrolase n=1 Tax=Jannaschia sp. Os4 TaxID=2807617 RepID=UPI001939A357|nr:alpha/beta hydrolase [Jannaschia sp. Os4]MBM2576692.1 alpha/beta hydrolase [Jannaschia sp. Os4]
MTWLRRLGGTVAALALLAVGALALAGWAVSTPPGDPVPDPSPEARAAATAYLGALAPLPGGWTAGRFSAEPGVTLEVGRLPAAAPRKGTVVVVPGYTAPLELYGEEFAALAAAGWDVAALSQRGQGRSDRFGAARDMGHVEDYADLTRDLAAWIDVQAPPVAVMAMSKGGHVALRTLGERDVEVAALAAIVPMVDITTEPFPRPVARALAEVSDRVGLGGRYAPGPGAWDRAERFLDPGWTGAPTVCADAPERAHLRDALYVLDPDLRVDAPSLGWVAATLRATARLPAFAARVEVPILMVNAGRDRIVDAGAASALCAAMADCTERWLPEAPHCALEGDRARSAEILAAVTAFFAETVD